MTLQTTPRTSDNHLLKVADTISPHEHLQKKLKRRRDVVLNEARMTVEMQDSPQGCLFVFHGSDTARSALKLSRLITSLHKKIPSNVIISLNVKKYI